MAIRIELLASIPFLSSQVSTSLLEKQTWASWRARVLHRGGGYGETRNKSCWWYKWSPAQELHPTVIYSLPTLQVHRDVTPPSPLVRGIWQAFKLPEGNKISTAYSCPEGNQ